MFFHNSQIKRMLREVLGNQAAIMRRLDTMEKAMSEKFAKLEQAVERSVTVQQAGVALIKGLSDSIKDAVGTGDLDEVNKLADQINNSADALAAAISANTPAANAGTGADSPVA